MSPRVARNKTRRNCRPWIALRRSWCVSVHFNLDRYNYPDQRSRFDGISELQFKPRGPSILSEEQRSTMPAQSDVHDATTSPPYHDSLSRPMGGF